MKYFSPGFSKKQGLNPPDLYEYSIDNFWFKSAGVEHEKSLKI
jgi:hypothetical protein